MKRIALVFATLPLLAAPAFGQGFVQRQPFTGVWTCDPGQYTFTNETINSGKGPVKITEVEEDGGDYILTLEDGQRVALLSFSDAGMGYTVEATGETFHCNRLYH